MEFTIEKGKEKRKKEPHYKLEIEFMFGDADGEEFVSTIIDQTDIENAKSLILATACCCAAYPGGRGGGDEYDGLPEYDAFFLEDFADPDNYVFVFNEDDSNEIAQEKVNAYLESLNPNGYGMEHPWDPTGGDMHATFRNYKLYFIDADGDKSNVKITFNEEELAEIERAKKHFK